MTKVEVSQRAREFAWHLVPRNSIAGQDREGFFAGRYDDAKAVKSACAFERQLLDEMKGRIEGLKAVQPSCGDSERRNAALDEALAALGGDTK